ncbi:RHTO0S06e02124g1_1 [Rhodotorula toruloides]|uniref:RHTO0S06e02124g1_1 n=2 Tax=Rhodotorula toruloides TaxID=5286 RepID=A0A061AV67_RHOTO|nr:putative eukaryotic translation initiation factor 2 subunit beta [Rhodotorula toruloides]CDR41467.1 RHTO0S06e02124g1_1 [Rhodotorula toruloides]
MADIDPPVDDIFAGIKKKKKGTKKVNLDDLELDAPAPAESKEDAPANDDGDLDFASLKKKKKKSVRIDSDAEDEEDVKPKKGKRVDKLGNEIDDDEQPSTPPAESADASGGLDDFSDLKKRKKKTKKTFDLDAFDKELAETEAAGGEDDEEAPQPKSILKKKATPAGSDDEDEGVDEDEPVEGEDPFAKEDRDEDSQTSKAEAAAQAKAWLKEDRDYTYTELLGRFFSLLYQSHPSLSGGAGKKKYTIPPPQLFREGNKRSIFANIADICKRMHRQPEHVIQFLFAELGTNGSVDGSSRLVIKGRFQQKQIENVLRRYIVEYVTCKTCKSPDTTLTKDNRLFFLTCSSCGSTRSVAGIKTGFQAATRAARRAARA